MLTSHLPPPRPLRSGVGIPLRRPLLVLVGVALAGCGLFPRQVPGPYTPEVAGVVVAIEPTDTNLTRFTLDNGRMFSASVLDATATIFVYRRGGGVGDLLLAGSGPDRPWLAFLAPAGRSDLPVDCYAVYGFGTDEGEWIQTDIGLRLRKAPEFDPGLLPDTPDGPVPTTHPGLRYEGVQQTFCVNRDGLVTARD